MSSSSSSSSSSPPPPSSSSSSSSSSDVANEEVDFIVSNLSRHESRISTFAKKQHSHPLSLDKTWHGNLDKKEFDTKARDHHYQLKYENYEAIAGPVILSEQEEQELLPIPNTVTNHKEEVLNSVEYHEARHYARRRMKYTRVIIMDEHPYNPKLFGQTHYHHATAASTVEAAKYLYPNRHRDNIELVHVHGLDVKKALNHLRDFHASMIVLGNLKVNEKDKEVYMGRSKLSFTEFIFFLKAAKKLSNSLATLLILGDNWARAFETLVLKMEIVIMFQRKIEYTLQLQFAEKLMVELFHGNPLSTAFSRACFVLPEEFQDYKHPTLYTFPSLEHRRVTLLQASEPNAVTNLPLRDIVYKGHEYSLERIRCHLMDHPPLLKFAVQYGDPRAQTKLRIKEMQYWEGPEGLIFTTADGSDGTMVDFTENFVHSLEFRNSLLSVMNKETNKQYSTQRGLQNYFYRGHVWNHETSSQHQTGVLGVLITGAQLASRNAFALELAHTMYYTTMPRDKAFTWWVDASSDHTLQVGLLDLAVEFGHCSEQEAYRVSTDHVALMKFLNAFILTLHRIWDWTLVLADVPDEQWLMERLPALAHHGWGSVIITSPGRVRDFPSITQAAQHKLGTTTAPRVDTYNYRVEMLDQRDMNDLFYLHAGPMSQDNQTSVSQHLIHSTLYALHGIAHGAQLFGNLVRQHPEVSVATIVQKLTQHRDTFAAKSEFSANWLTRQTTFNALIMTSIEYAQRHFVKAVCAAKYNLESPMGGYTLIRDILSFMSMIHWNSIPYGLLHRFIRLHCHLLDADQETAEMQNEIIMELTMSMMAHGLLRRNAEPSFEMLVHVPKSIARMTWDVFVQSDKGHDELGRLMYNAQRTLMIEFAFNKSNCASFGYAGLIKLHADRFFDRVAPMAIFGYRCNPQDTIYSARALVQLGFQLLEFSSKRNDYQASTLLHEKMARLIQVDTPQPDITLRLRKTRGQINLSAKLFGLALNALDTVVVHTDDDLAQFSPAKITRYASDLVDLSTCLIEWEVPELAKQRLESALQALKPIANQESPHPQVWQLYIKIAQDLYDMHVKQGDNLESALQLALLIFKQRLRLEADITEQEAQVAYDCVETLLTNNDPEAIDNVDKSYLDVLSNVINYDTVRCLQQLTDIGRLMNKPGAAILAETRILIIHEGYRQGDLYFSALMDTIELAYKAGKEEQVHLLCKKATFGINRFQWLQISQKLKLKFHHQLIDMCEAYTELGEGPMGTYMAKALQEWHLWAHTQYNMGHAKVQKFHNPSDRNSFIKAGSQHTSAYEESAMIMTAGAELMDEFGVGSTAQIKTLVQSAADLQDKVKSDSYAFNYREFETKTRQQQEFLHPEFVRLYRSGARQHMHTAQMLMNVGLWDVARIHILNALNQAIRANEVDWRDDFMEEISALAEQFNAVEGRSLDLEEETTKAINVCEGFRKDSLSGSWLGEEVYGKVEMERIVRR